MRLFIPDVGTVLQLEKDWTFTLVLEWRNQKAAEAMLIIPKNPDGTRLRADCYNKNNNTWKETKVIISAGTQLKVDRVYIRKGKASEFNSLSFYIINGKKKVRFFASLSDVNRIECRVV